ncbi:hypothetical protein V500_00326 [Pseudogymnoascus sp. VKM F-4518 (FW-2643)]|nr:hypothetical protein V500_00326 [Pseudogymnoascus sp. VKM F-4518 (FW-2643)]
MQSIFADASSLSAKQPPLMIYGTAWKEAKTGELTESALKNGFTGVDTANYHTAYNEPLTGDGIAAALSSGLTRDGLFIQSKFSPLWTHEKDKVPFSPDQGIEDQVKESIQQTFDHLKVDYLDALLLHAPFENDEDNLIAWTALETFVPHKMHRLGLSNIRLTQLQHIYAAATVKPTIVQNRFYKGTKYDLDVRAFCSDHDIVYQAFWMLTHNPEVLASEVVATVAQKLEVEKELAFYVLILCLGKTQVLNGTTNIGRMEEDVKTIKRVFSNDELLKELQPFIVTFKRLLWDLSGRKEKS